MERTANSVRTDVLGGPSHETNIKLRRGGAYPNLAIRALRGLNRIKFPPSKPNNASNPTRVSFSIFAVLFEAAKARFLLSDNRVRISRCSASALARDIGGS